MIAAIMRTPPAWLPQSRRYRRLRLPPQQPQQPQQPPAAPQPTPRVHNLRVPKNRPIGRKPRSASGRAGPLMHSLVGASQPPARPPGSG